jgi:hypothetical protein
MKTIFSFLSVLLFCSLLHAQSLSPKVIASAGGYFASANASLSWTLGEPVTATFTNGNNMLTQGFQQPSVSVVLMNLRAFLEGYYTGGGMMDNSGAGGCLYVTGQSANPLDADYVTVSAINPVTLNVVDTKTAIMKTNGSVSFTFGNAVSAGSSYYIRVRHRNAIETWSANPVVMSANTSYDFTTAANKAYGNNMIQTFDNGGFAFFSGDISDASSGVGFQDNIVESQDYLDMENAVQLILLGYNPQDITGDGIVEAGDYLVMENNVNYVRFTLRP